MAIVFFLLGMLVPLVACLWVSWRIANMLKARGYASPMVHNGVVIVGITITIVVGVMLPFIVTDWRSVRGPITYEMAFETGAFWTFGSLAGIGAAWLTTRRLPTRTTRTSGPRTVTYPYHGTGVLCRVAAGLAVVAWVVLWYVGGDASRYLSLLSFAATAIGASYWFFYQAQRASVPTAEQVQSLDSRRSVLYLRAFDHEEEMFVELPWTWGGLLANGAKAYFQTFDEYFVSAIGDSIGPLVALGDPTDYLPPAEGAARTWVADANWQKDFAERVEQMACVVMAPDDSENLLWELGWLREHGCHTRLFILTSPRWPGQRYLQGWSGQLRRCARFLPGRDGTGDDPWPRVRGVIPRPWKTFAAALSRLGYSVVDDPGPGAVVTFDEAGRMVVLAHGAALPETFVQAMKTWLTRSPVTSEPITA